MSTRASGDSHFPPDVPPSEAPTRRRSGTSVAKVVILFVCAGFIAWAGSAVWENLHPLEAASRRIRARDASERVAAIRQVSELGSGASGTAIRSVIPAIEDPDAGVRVAAAEALGVLGLQAVRSGSDSELAGGVAKSLLGAIKDREPGVRIAATGALSILVQGATKPRAGRGSAKSAKPLQASEPSSTSVDSKGIASAFLDLLDDSDAAVREAGLCAIRDIPPDILGEPPPKLIAATEDASETNRAIAIAVAAGFPRGLDPILPIVFRHLEHDELMVRDACARALGRIRPSALSSDAIPAVITGLGSRDRKVRLALVPLLARLAPEAPASVPALIGVLKEPIDSDSTIMGRDQAPEYVGPAHEAARALGKIAPRTARAPQAISALAEVVRSGPAQRRATASRALGQFGPAALDAVPALIDMLKESESRKEPNHDGAAAAEALALIAARSPATPEAVAALTTALNSRSNSTREGAAEALGAFGPAAAGALKSIKVLKDDDPAQNVRKAAESALEAIQGGSK